MQDENFRTLVETDPSQTVRGMMEELGVSSHAVFDGLKRIGKVKKLEKWVSHDLNDRQKSTRLEVCFFAIAQQKRSFFGRMMKSESSTTTRDVQDTS